MPDDFSLTACRAVLASRDGLSSSAIYRDPEAVYRLRTAVAEVERLRAALDRIHASSGWMTYDPLDDGYVTHDTEADARAAFASLVDDARDRGGDGWSWCGPTVAARLSTPARYYYQAPGGSGWADTLIRHCRSHTGALMPTDLTPIPMLLTCPVCGDRHIDAGRFATYPHHTHACQSCGTVWRPALVPTVGVQFLPGFQDEETPDAR